MIDNPLNRTHARRGSQLPWSKLTESDVALIRELFEERQKLRDKLSSLTNAEIAKKFEVHQRTIDRISSGENWTHVV